MQHTFRTFWNTNFAFMTISRSAAHQDWHPADVLAALKKRGKTLAGISKANGYHATAAIGLAPEEIWPARYAERRPAAAGRGKGAGQR
jgi:Ner family transcriptional regulator